MKQYRRTFAEHERKYSNTLAMKVVHHLCVVGARTLGTRRERLIDE